jgi:hypothetical protein
MPAKIENVSIMGITRQFLNSQTGQDKNEDRHIVTNNVTVSKYLLKTFFQLELLFFRFNSRSKCVMKNCYSEGI